MYSHSACHRHLACRRRDADADSLAKLQVASIKKISACLNSVASVNPAVLIDRAERGLRKMVKDETHDRLTSTVSFWSSIGFYSLCSSSMLLVNKMVLARLPYASTLSLIQICAAVVFIHAVFIFLYRWRFLKYLLLSGQSLCDSL